MRNFIKIVEEIIKYPRSHDYILSAKKMLSERLSNHIECDLGISWETNEDGIVEIEHIAANPMGKGWGSKAMKILCDLADERGIYLHLGVANETDDWYQGDEDDGALPSESVLIDFYSGFGFGIRGGLSDRVNMLREPQ